MSQRFRFPIIIPPTLRITIKLGDKIERGQSLGQLTSGQAFDIDIAVQLGISPKEVGKYLLVPVGHEIKAGEVVAKLKTTFKEKQVVSPQSGKVQKISPENGTVTLSLKPDHQKGLESPVSGEVITLTSGLIELAVAGKIYQAVEIGGLTGWGPLGGVGQWGTAKIEDLTISQLGKIVISADKINHAWLSKAAALDVAGVVCAGLQPDQDPEVKIPFVSLPSETNNQLDRRLWENLTDNEGKIALINPKEKILGITD